MKHGDEVADSLVRGCLILAVLMVGVLIAPVPARAIEISFQATDLDDISAGQDLWEYAYSVSEYTFSANFGFSVSFDHLLYASLSDPPPVVNDDWDVITLEPESSLPADGLYDALALVNAASIFDPFMLTFVWLGGPRSAPGPQPYTVSEFDETGKFIGIVDAGTTVPEPTILDAITAISVIGLAALRSSAAHTLRATQRRTVPPG